MPIRLARDGAIQSGMPAPAFDVRAIDGRDISLSALRGKVVMLDFWATWCGPCQMATPTLEQLYKDYGPHGFVLIGFSVDDFSTARYIPGYVQHFGMTYPVTATSDGNASVVSKYKVASFPTQFVIDKHGVVRWSQPGYSYDEDARLRDLIPTLLNRP